MDKIDILSYVVLGMYFAFDLILGLALLMHQAGFSKQGQGHPTIKLAGISMISDAVAVLIRIVKSMFLPDAVFFVFVHPVFDLTVTSLFILTCFALLSDKYPSRREVLSIALSALACYAVCLVSGSMLLFGVVSFVWMAAVFVFTVRRMRRYHNMLAFYYSNTKKHRATWFIYFMIWGFVAYPCYKVATLTSSYGPAFYNAYALLAMVIEAVVSYRLIRQSMGSSKVVANLYEYGRPEEEDQSNAGTERLTANMYFSAEKQLQMKEQLRRFMVDDKLYRDAELCVGDLVKRMDTNASYFYYFMRDVMDSSFSDYVNGYRVEEAKELLSKGEKIDYIVAKVGFNSDNTFRRAFRRSTGLTPSQWRQATDQR